VQYTTNLPDSFGGVFKYGSPPHPTPAKKCSLKEDLRSHGHTGRKLLIQEACDKLCGLLRTG
jgi:hypothetical protein